MDLMNMSIIKCTSTKLFLVFVLATTTMSSIDARCWGGSCGNNNGYWHWSNPRSHRRHNRYYYNRRGHDKITPVFDTVGDIFYYMPEYFTLYVRKIQEQHYERQEEMEKKLNEEQALNNGKDYENIEKEEQHQVDVALKGRRNTGKITEAESEDIMGVSENHNDDGSIELELEVPEGISAKDLSVEIDEDDSIIRVKGIHKIHNLQKEPSRESSIITRARLGTIIESKFEHIFQVGKDMDITQLKVTLTSSGLVRILVPKKEKKGRVTVFDILTEDNSDEKSAKNKNKLLNDDNQKDDTKSTTEKVMEEKESEKNEDDYDFVIMDDEDDA